MGHTVSSEATNEYMMRLAKYITNPDTPAKDVALAEELYQFLDLAQKQLLKERDQLENIHRHLLAVSEGFRDREMRVRRSIAEGYQKVKDMNHEINLLRGVLERSSSELGGIREQHAQMLLDRKKDEEQFDAEESEHKNRIATI